MKHVKHSEEQVSKFLRKCTLFKVTDISGKIEMYYGGADMSKKRVVLCYDKLRSNPLGFSFEYNDIKNTLVTKNNISILLNNGVLICGVIQGVFEIPLSLCDFLNLPPQLFEDSPTEDGEKIINLHLLDTCSELIESLKYKYLFSWWGADVLYDTENNTPLTLCLKYIENLGVKVGVWNIKDKCYFKKPKIVKFIKELV